MTKPNQNGDAFPQIWTAVAGRRSGKTAAMKTLVQAFSSWDQEGFSRKIRARGGNLVSVSIQQDVPPLVHVRADIPGTASVQVGLSRKATAELIQALQDALNQFELDAVHGS